MNREELEELYNEFVINNGDDYWKYVIIEHLLRTFKKSFIFFKKFSKKVLTNYKQYAII